MWEYPVHTAHAIRAYKDGDMSAWQEEEPQSQARDVRISIARSGTFGVVSITDALLFVVRKRNGNPMALGDVRVLLLEKSGF